MGGREGQLREVFVEGGVGWLRLFRSGSDGGREGRVDGLVGTVGHKSVTTVDCLGLDGRGTWGKRIAGGGGGQRTSL